jgi:hypothetical protein
MTMKAISKETLKTQSHLLGWGMLRGALVASILWLILGNMDWYAPLINLKPEIFTLGQRTDFILEASDQDTGLRDIKVSIIQSGKERQILTRAFPSQGFLFGSKGTRINKLEIPFVLDVRGLGLQGGEAKLVVQAHDYSWRNWFHGRQAQLTRDVQIILSPSETK